MVKWSKRLKETGSSAPAKFGGHKRCRLEPHRDFVLAQVEEVPHLTLHKLKDARPLLRRAFARVRSRLPARLA